MEVEAPVKKPKPLIRGSEGFPTTPVPIDEDRGFLTVSGEPVMRDGIIVQRCICGCNQAACALAADVDVRFLNNPADYQTEDCPLQTEAVFPPFSEVLEAARAQRVRTVGQYRRALVEGYLPVGSPSDPTRYEEWTSWADFTGSPEYHSKEELFDALFALDLDSLGLLPRPDRRRVLVFSRYWASIKGRAAELGIAEKDIPDRLDAIVASLRPASTEWFSDASSSSDSPGLGGPGSTGGKNKSSPGEVLHLSSESEVIVNSVTIWLPSGPEIQAEIINGFYHNAWELLDREDTLKGPGAGIALVEETILQPLTSVKPELVEEFRRQFAGVSHYKVKGRNWMQAYSLWYAEDHNRFINWSSAGLGKTRTIPALVHHYDIPLTVFFSPKAITNEHNPQIAAELEVEDPLAVLHYSDYGVPTELEPGKHHYFIANPEKLQMNGKTREMIDALLKLNPGLFVFDEGHLLVSISLVNPETGETVNDPKFRPRMNGLRYLLDRIRQDQRVVVLTGTPVRVDAREGQALFELIAEDIGAVSKEMSELNALRLRGRLQQFGFRFLNHRLPEFRRFVYPFMVPDGEATILNRTGGSLAEKEARRIDCALGHIRSLKGKVVINTEGLNLSPSEAVPVQEFDDDQIGSGKDPLLGASLPLVRLNYEPMDHAVNPVYYSYFIDGPVKAISEHLQERGEKFRLCTGESEKDELGEYLTRRDSSLIASSSWSTGVDGSQKVSNAVVTLGICWHDSGHRQMVARIHRQGACTPDGTPTRIVHEIIPVALNVAYDVRRLNKVYSRRSFSEVLSLGEITEPDGEESELETAVKAIEELQRQARLPGL